MARKSAKPSGRRKTASGRRKKGAVRKAASTARRAVKRAAVTVLDKAGGEIHRAASQAAEREQKSQKKAARRAAVSARPRPVARTSTPIPDADLRTPAQTSSHGPFDRRSERDPDKILPGEKLINEQFAEVDEYTNKTGDPRIGTRGRTYRP